VSRYVTDIKKSLFNPIVFASGGMALKQLHYV